MSMVSKDAPGKEVLMMGNEAIARGALEAGVSVAAAYPGNPSSEIIGSLASVADEMGIYVEWSINEKVALEVAAAAAFSGLNSLVAMKQNGMNVASDFLLNLNLSGIAGGLVLVVCDDPSGISSTNEQDSRIFAKLADLPLMEPATFHEAKDMIKEAFDLSRKINNVCIVRSVTRISHARGNVILGSLPKSRAVPHFDISNLLSAMPTALTHPRAHDRLKQAGQFFAESRFNSYEGPQNPELLIVTCGAGFLFTREAVNFLGLDERVGIMKIGTTWPLPERFILDNFKKTEKVLFVEEVDPVLENNVKEIFADHNSELPRITFFGKKSGAVPSVGELSPGLIIQILADLLGVAIPEIDTRYIEQTKSILSNFAPAAIPGFLSRLPTQGHILEHQEGVGPGRSRRRGIW